MKLNSKNLRTQLAKGLSPTYVISGDEILLVEESLDAVRAAAREQGFTERESYSVNDKFNWDPLFSGLNNLSLFAEKKIIELRVPTGKPGRTGGEALSRIAAEPVEDTLFVIILPKLDGKTKNTKWVGNLTRQAAWVDVFPVGADGLVDWLRQRAETAGLSFDRDALELLALRTEGNLLAAQQEIDKLVLLHSDKLVTPEILSTSIADGARFDVFQLSDAAVDQDFARALRILSGLRNDGTATPLVSWALVREAQLLFDLWAEIDAGASIGAALQKYRVFNHRQPAYRRALQAHDETSVRRLYKFAGAIDFIVKGRRFAQPWVALNELVLLMARPRQPGPLGYSL